MKASDDFYIFSGFGAGRMNQEWKGKRFDRRYCAELLDQRNYILQLSVTLWQDENLPEMCPRFWKFSPDWPYKALNWVTGTRGTFPPVIDTLWPALIKTFRVRTFRDNWVIYTWWPWGRRHCYPGHTLGQTRDNGSSHSHHEISQSTQTPSASSRQCTENLNIQGQFNRAIHILEWR